MNRVVIAYNSTRSKRRSKEAVMDLEKLTDDQKAKARACKTPEEMLDMAREEGYELSDEQLEAVSGGWSCDSFDFSLPDD